jgi:4-hydroxy-4-methyl-2-oxoglutarate aldolase
VTALLPPVSAVADVLALWGRDGWLTPPLHPVVAPSAPRLGRARTVDVRPGSSGSGLAPVYDLLSTDLTDAAVVVAAPDVPGAVWGEILATAAHGAGAVAVLVDGSVRDAPAMTALGLPVFAGSQRVVGPNGAAHVVATDAAVSLGTVTVDADDHVLVDATGAVRITADVLADVLAAAVRYAAAEDEVLAALAAGERLDTAYLHKKSIVDELARGR